MALFSLPANQSRVLQVRSFHELVTTPMIDGVNALCWERKLPGNFQELVSLLEVGEGIMPLDEEHLRNLPASAEGRVAANIMLDDLGRLQALGLAPELNCIHGYPRDEAEGPVATDVFSFHVDSAPVRTDTWLCTYHGAASEGLAHHEAQRKVDMPATRQALLALYGGEDDPDFSAFLQDHCYDLHYEPLPGAQPFNFGQGNLWRIATEWPGNPVPPCIHRAPFTTEADPPRLLLIS